MSSPEKEAGLDLSPYTLAQIREMGGEIAGEAERRLAVARQSSESIRDVWNQDLTLLERKASNLSPEEYRRLISLRKKLSGESIPSRASRRSIYGKAGGSLPRGWVREVFPRQSGPQNSTSK